MSTDKIACCHHSHHHHRCRHKHHSRKDVKEVGSGSDDIILKIKKVKKDRKIHQEDYSKFKKGSWADLLSDNRIDRKKDRRERPSLGPTEVVINVPSAHPIQRQSCTKVLLTDDIYLEAHTHASKMSCCSVRHETGHLQKPHAGLEEKKTRPAINVNIDNARCDEHIGTKCNERNLKDRQQTVHNTNFQATIAEVIRCNNESYAQAVPPEISSVEVPEAPNSMPKELTSSKLPNIGSIRLDSNVDATGSTPLHNSHIKQPKDKSAATTSDTQLRLLQLENASLKQRTIQLLELVEIERIDRSEYLKTIENLVSTLENQRSKEFNVIAETLNEKQKLQKLLVQTNLSNKELNQSLEDVIAKSSKGDSHDSGRVSKTSPGRDPNIDKLKDAISDLKDIVAKEIEGVSSKNLVRSHEKRKSLGKLDRYKSSLAKYLYENDIESQASTKYSFGSASAPSRRKERDNEVIADEDPNSTQYLNLPDHAPSFNRFIPSPLP